MVNDLGVETPVRYWIGWLLTQLKVTGQGTGEAWGMQSLTVETLRYGSGGQMCRRKRDRSYQCACAG